MNINDIATANTAKAYLGLSPSTQSASAVAGAGSAGLQKAEKRIQTQVDSTSAQLSSLGKLQSSVSGAQLAAHTLGGLTANSTNANVKTAADNFLSAFNGAVTTAKTTATVTADPGASQSAGRVGKNLARTVSESSATIDALKKIGFSMAADGTLALDAKKFEAAQKADPTSVKTTLTKIGQQVDKAATQELTTGSSLSGSLTSLSQRAAVLKSQQSALTALQQTATSTQSSAYSMFGGFGSAAYQNY